MKLNSTFIASLLFFSGASFHVSASRAETVIRLNPGATLESARDQIREMKKNSGLPEGGVTVQVPVGTMFRENTFLLTAEDSGTAAAPVCYRCEKGAAILEGGKKIPLADLPTAEAFLRARPETAATYSKLPGKARANIRVLDLKAAGVPFYRRLPDRFNDAMCAQPLGVKAGENGYEPVRNGSKEIKWNPLTVFCDERPMHAARWPNGSWTNVYQITDSGKGFGGNGIIRPGRFIQPDLRDKLREWAAGGEVFLRGFFCKDYYDSTLRVGIDPEKNEVNLLHEAMDEPSFPFQRFYALHLPGELDEPGEWYLDRAAGALYFWPYPGARTLLATVLRMPLVAMNAVAHVTFSGFVFEGCREQAITIERGASNRVVACEFKNLTGREAISICESEGNRVAGCDFHELGQGGVTIRAGDRETIKSAGNVVDNCHFWRTSQMIRMYTGPIDLGGVGNTARNNLIHDIPHTAIFFRGNEHRMENNEIFNALEEVNESGAIYAGYCLTSRGNLIRNNFIHHLSGMEGSRTPNSIMLDDGFSSVEMISNFFYKVNSGIVISGGNGNAVIGNTFVDCDKCVSVGGSWMWKMLVGDGRGEITNAAPSPILYSDMRRMGWTRPPYTERYPMLKELAKKIHVSWPWWNPIIGNTFIRCGRTIQPGQAMLDQWECRVADNRTNAECNVSMEGPRPGIGLYDSPERFRWPVRIERPSRDWLPRWRAGVSRHGFATSNIHLVFDKAPAGSLKALANCEVPEWQKDRNRVTCDVHSLRSEYWRKTTFSFLPLVSGDIRFVLLGGDGKSSLYRILEINGAKAKGLKTGKVLGPASQNNQLSIGVLEVQANQPVTVTFEGKADES